MSKASIRAEISRLRREIDNLENNKNSYENMNVKIDKAIGELTSAKNSAKEAYQLLGQNYQSTTADRKVLELEGEHTNISNVIKTLESEILVASNNKINEIEKSINRKKREIRELRDELASMDD